MPSLYNCKTDGDQWRITKFDEHMNVEASYLCTESECECPAGSRPTCRHRQMLPKFVARGAINCNWMWDHDRGGWTDMRTQDELDKSAEKHDGDEYLAGIMQAQPVATQSVQNERDEDWARHQAEIEPAPAPRLPWRRF